MDSTCSSPEQETVRPKQSSTRGPHVQDLFTRGSESARISIIESVSTTSKENTEIKTLEGGTQKDDDKTK